MIRTGRVRRGPGSDAGCHDMTGGDRNEPAKRRNAMLSENRKMSWADRSRSEWVGRPCSIAGFAFVAASGAGYAQDFNAAPPNAEGQTAAFENQTRAPVLPDIALQQQVIAEGL